MNQTPSQPTDQALKLALAKMLSEKLYLHNRPKCDTVYWSGNDRDQTFSLPVQDTEWLHVCWLVEQQFNNFDHQRYVNQLYEEAEPHTRLMHPDCSPSWQQRAIALAKVKGVEI